MLENYSVKKDEKHDIYIITTPVGKTMQVSGKTARVIYDAIREENAMQVLNERIKHWNLEISDSDKKVLAEKLADEIDNDEMLFEIQNKNADYVLEPYFKD